MFRKLVSAVAALGLVLGASSSAEAKKSKDECKNVKPEHELKMATMAPQNSAWSKEFAKWSDDVVEETDCRVQLKWYYGMMSEQQILDDLRSGAKHGAAMTGSGLAQINKNILLLQLPGAFATWGDLDAAREKVKPKLEELFAAAGFMIAGWGDVGASKILSTDTPIRTPKDLAGKGVFHLPGDLLAPKLLSQFPGVQPRAMALTELSQHLGKDVQVITTPPFAATQLQWAPKINHVTLITPAFAIGALVFKKEKLDALGPELTAAVARTGKKYGESLTASIRKMDADAFKTMKDTKNKVELKPEEVAEWEKAFKATREALKSEFDPALYAKLFGDKK